MAEANGYRYNSTVTYKSQFRPVKSIKSIIGGFLVFDLFISKTIKRDRYWYKLFESEDSIFIVESEIDDVCFAIGSFKNAIEI